ncbi:unnamed protein product [Sphenostylis stenocarpa]|uniref:GATA transcription factor n=1 Tax=Sphenostylis stenocarpa TaxID=92480 RepID=A0AA86S9I4_9FABA|nr:unnamed protein product [Sphenostylis stenocarpa]
MEDIDCSSFFDHIDDLLEFPEEMMTADTTITAPVAAPPTSFWSTQSHSLPTTNMVFSDNAPDLSAEFSVPVRFQILLTSHSSTCALTTRSLGLPEPVACSFIIAPGFAVHASRGNVVSSKFVNCIKRYEDIVQLEWLSNFVEDSFSDGTLTMQQEGSQCTTKEEITHAQFQTASPVSVLESSSFCSKEKAAPRTPEIYIPVPCGRARSKRARPAAFNPHPVMQLISPASSTGENTHHNATSSKTPDSENFAESMIKKPKQASSEHKKKRKIKVTFSAGQDHNAAPSQALRKCLHCEITKTPQWRAGPMGPKTLCNACGVRYKSGRLFPEYRPAASPTFCAALHSNSHKKVLEMRNMTGTKSDFAADSAASPELIPNTNSSLSLEYM